MGHGTLMAGGNGCGMECSGSWQRPTSKQRARGKIFGGEQSMRVKRGSMLLETFAFEKHTAIHAHQLPTQGGQVPNAADN